VCDLSLIIKLLENSHTPYPRSSRGIEIVLTTSYIIQTRQLIPTQVQRNVFAR
jgi:hypothetical protein